MAKLYSCLSSLFIVIFIVKAFIPLPFLTTFMAIIAVLFFCLSFQKLKPLNRNMIILLLIGSGLLIWSGPGNFDWSRAMTENAGIVSLLLTAPMLGIILYYAPYEMVLLSFANRYIRTNYVFYVLTLCLVSFSGVLMNLAAVPFVNQIIVPLMTKFPIGILHRALFRGYAVNLFWAPNMICVAVVLQYVNISWQELAPVGIIFSALSFIAACVVEKYDIPSGESCLICQTDSVEQVNVIPDSRRCIVYLVIQILLIVVALTILIRYAGKSIYVALAIVTIVMPFLFAVALNKVGVYRQRLSYYFRNTLPGMCNEFMLFINIGFFGYALTQSTIIAIVQAHLSSISDYSSSVLVILIISIITGLSMIGIHPIITISSLAIAFGKMSIGLSSLQLAVTLLTGYIMYFFLSPFASMVMIMSGLTGQNVYTIGLKLNWRYALVLSMLVTFSIYVWRQI